MSILDRYPTATATELLAALRAREVSAAELLDAAIARIDALDETINAVVVRDYDQARVAAVAADAQLAKGEGGALCGLPMTVKESYDLAGHPTTWGVADYSGHRAATDALAVERLKRAGAVVLGKTNDSVMLADWQAENPVYGRTGNPYDLGRSPGGSSGGSAAALAAGYVPAEIGSDIGGSIRIPAAFNGVFGHKPSYGLVPALGHMPGGAQLAPAPLAVCGPMARSAEDLRRLLPVVAGPTPAEAIAYSLNLVEPRHAALRDYRVLILDHHPSAPLSADIVTALHALASRLEKAGARVSRDAAELPDLKAAHGVYLKMLLAFVSRRGADGREPINAHEWFDLADEQDALRRQWADVFRRWDVVVAPAFGSPAFPHADEPDWRKRRILIDGEPTRYGDQLAWPGLATLPHLPATAFPIGMDSQGLPIGAQAIGPFLEDLTPIAFAGHAASDFIPPKL